MAKTRFVGAGFESVFGTEVAAKYFLDPSRVSLDAPSDPFLRYGGASGLGQRSIVPGIYVPGGDIEAVVDLWRCGWLFRGFIPEINYQQQAPNKGTGASTTLSADESAGQTVLSVVMADNFSVDDVIQVGADFGGSELHKVTAVDDVLDTLTIDDPLTRAHLTGEDVKTADAVPYLHIMDIGGDVVDLDSFSVRVAKDFDEHLFLGSVINQLQFSVDFNGLFNLTASVVAQKDQPDTVTLMTEASVLGTTPYAGPHLNRANLAHTGGGDDKDISSYIRSAEFTFSNNVQGEDGVRMGSRFPTEMKIQSLEATARLTLVFRTRDQYEDFWGAAAGPQENAFQTRDIDIEWTQGTNYLINLWLFNAHLITPAAEVSGRDMLVQTLEYEAVQTAGFGAGSTLGSIRLKNAEEFRYY